jgi:Fe2+ transport system protein FeoA
MTERHPASGIALPDHEYHKLIEILKNQRSVKLKNTQGVETKFYYRNGKLVGDTYKGLVRQTSEVFNINELARQEENSFLNITRRRMKADHPEWSEEEVEAQADVINEANETIKRLMTMGVDYKVAVGVVKHTLNSDTIEQEVEEIRKLLSE